MTPTKGQPVQKTAMQPTAIAIEKLFSIQKENDSITRDAETAEGRNEDEQKKTPGERVRKSKAFPPTELPKIFWHAFTNRASE